MVKKLMMSAMVAAVAVVATAEEAGFKTLGAMIDVSRGRVLKVDYLKGRFQRMKEMGYNSVMLYTEDTFKLDGEPKWGYMRGGYTKDDVRALKAEADRLGMTMIPCLETLGHLEQPLRWSEYKDISNTGYTIIVGEEKTYQLLDKIIAFWAETVGGTRVHLGMDEAWGFAGAKYEKKNGKRPTLDVFLEHLTRVNEICAKHGFTEPIIWSDMFYRIASAKHDYYDPEAKADATISARIPKNVRLCYWDYYHATQAYYEGMIDGHRSFGSEPILAGGIQIWSHLLHDREKTLGTMGPMIAAARKKGVQEFFFTLWGDDGAMSIPAISEEGLFACAEMAAGRTAEPNEENCKRFKKITGFDYRAMAKLGDVNRHYADEWPDMIQEATILYDDPLYCGNYRNYLVRKPSETTDRRFYCAVYKDAAWRDDGEKVMADYRQVLDECATLKGVPPAAAALVKALQSKVNYEADVLAAWKAKDRDTLARLATNDLKVAISNMKSFDRLYRTDWYATSQPFGYERVQKRNAAALVRLEEAKRRLDDYLKGKTATIEEYDEAMKPFGKYQEAGIIRW